MQRTMGDTWWTEMLNMQRLPRGPVTDDRTGHRDYPLWLLLAVKNKLFRVTEDPTLEDARSVLEAIDEALARAALSHEGGTLPALRYTRFQGAIEDAEKNRIAAHPLYKLGDTIAIWVNEGDLAMLEMQGVARAALQEGQG